MCLLALGNETNWSTNHSNQHTLSRQEELKADSCNSIPGQGFMLHLYVCESSPWTVQSLPPNLGAGLSHVRVRNLVPVPQDLVHSENSDHCEKFPSTVKSEIMNRMYFTGTINRVQGIKQNWKTAQTWYCRKHSSCLGWHTCTCIKIFLVSLYPCDLHGKVV